MDILNNIDLSAGVGLAVCNAPLLFTPTSTGLSFELELLSKFGTMAVMYMWLRASRKDNTTLREDFTQQNDKTVKQFKDSGDKLKEVYEARVQDLKQQIEFLQKD